MCGIATYNLTDKEAHASQAIARSALCSLVDRGRDASGMAWRGTDGRIIVAKAAIPGTRAADGATGRRMTSPVGLVHTRWATKGSPESNENNHPILAGGIVGVHNGHCSNDDALISRLRGYKRKGQVDSEAIFATIGHGSGPLVGNLGRIRGSAAIAWFDRSENETAPRTSHVARLARSPLWFATTTGGSFVAASTRYHVTRALADSGLTGTSLVEVPEGIYFSVTEGAVSEWQTVAPFYREDKWEWGEDETEDWMQMALAFAEARQVSRGKRRAS